MSRAVSRLAEACSRLSIAKRTFNTPSTLPPPSSSTYFPKIIETPSTKNGNFYEHFPQNQSIELPALDNPQKIIYTFPTLERIAPKIAPSPEVLTEILDKLAPNYNGEKVIEEPTGNSEKNAPIYLSPRLLTIRRRKMKKHKRRRRYDRDFFKYQKYHREKKLKAEREFQKRMKSLLNELEVFNPEKYVKDTIKMANKEWQDDLAPTGRKLYPHWSRFMSLEQLYGLPKSEYIDKRSGLATPEDAEKIKALKEKYSKLYRKK
ncbi:unnamed protein product [Caenorhabditis angaria]|uniref:Mitochondrial mRNA-processing protein COX24 C-terminal domain-containing protein n=1 Tax=Caenorhabditis angaria TaxID=860376 RepID=A0A9P1IC33_9PELO|nr:unnamed protein product [Caenorhabditis angaria]